MELTWLLVGRGAELEQVATLFRGSRGAIVLAGPAGVGKTRLASGKGWDRRCGSHIEAEVSKFGKPRGAWRSHRRSQRR